MPTDPHPLDVDSPEDDRGTAGEPTLPSRRYVARIETYEDAPDECTIFPQDADADELPTTWVSAEAGSYVSLEAMR
ncbi:DUF7511 domain-containing protein [Halobellus sp. EA9]|uniref:DUF7511 domain-containing protein n=1 Tax=Halobellus sp. EA9 TaxID=3421647 RepID=UPI003EB7AB70